MPEDSYINLLLSIFSILNLTDKNSNMIKEALILRLTTIYII